MTPKMETQLTPSSEHEPSNTPNSIQTEKKGSHEPHVSSEDGATPASFELRDATDEEIESLVHVSDKVPFAAWAVIFAGAAERFTYFGQIAPWRPSRTLNLSLIRCS